MIMKCDDRDYQVINEIINDAARAYQGHIPEDMWKEPYMLYEEMLHEIKDGVEFWGYKQDGVLVGVMGLQSKWDVTLIRHAYVRTANRNNGIGGKLLTHLCTLSDNPILIGTWRDAHWAIGFYRKHGFQLVRESEKEILLRKYWTVSRRHAGVSVVLGDNKWFEKET